MVRLDKLVADSLNITRSEAKTIIKKGRVTVNGETALLPERKCGEGDVLAVDGNTVVSDRFVYIMLNKPKGVISATNGKGETTVIDILPDEMKRKGLFPAGRLDKDTTGFVLLTNDGGFAHNLLSPAKHIDKTYIATLDKPVNEAVIADFEGGMTLGDRELLQAQLVPLNDSMTEVEVILRQGLYHQVKRMFLKHGITVLTLKRIAMGGLLLDGALVEGACRYITAEELKQIGS